MLCRPLSASFSKSQAGLGQQLPASGQLGDYSWPALFVVGLGTVWAPPHTQLDGPVPLIGTAHCARGKQAQRRNSSAQGHTVMGCTRMREKLYFNTASRHYRVLQVHNKLHSSFKSFLKLAPFTKGRN